jgi:hypothetical protein
MLTRNGFGRGQPGSAPFEFYRSGEKAARQPRQILKFAELFQGYAKTAGETIDLGRR